MKLFNYTKETNAKTDWENSSHLKDKANKGVLNNKIILLIRNIFGN